MSEEPSFIVSPAYWFLSVSCLLGGCFRKTLGEHTDNDDQKHWTLIEWY